MGGIARVKVHYTSLPDFIRSLGEDIPVSVSYTHLDVYKRQDTDSTTIEVVDMHNAETSLDYEGTYKGVFPAADCPGIETTLILNPDKTYTLHSVYIDRDSSFDDKGTYTLKGNLLTLKEENGEISYYKVEENRVRLLTDDKQEITGALADHYILNKE